LKLIPASALVVETPHPAYLPFGVKPLTKTESRQQLGLPMDRTVLLFFGIVRPYKGLKYLIEALAHVQQPVHLVIAGEFWDDVNIYRQQIETLSQSKSITLLNRYIPNEEAHQLFSAADGLVAPYVGGTQSGAAGLALGYGLPMIVTERVADGLPAGLTTDRATGEVNENVGYAQIVPAANPLALAQAIDMLISKLPTLTTAPIAVAEDWHRLVKVIEKIGQELL
jgi:glycosyltransferase involved in cell wall biosynthesis